MESEISNYNPPFSSNPLRRDGIFRYTFEPDEAEDSAGIAGGSNSTGVDQMSFENTLIPNYPFSLDSMHGAPHSYSHNIPLTGLDLMTDVTQFNSFPNSQSDHNLIGSGAHMPLVNGPVLDFPSSEGKVKGVYGSDVHDNIVASDNLRNSSSHLNNFQNLHVDKNILTIRSNVAGGFQITRKGGVTNSSTTHQPRINRNFLSHGASAHVIYPTPNSGEIGISDNSKVSSLQSDHLENFDAGFLTLGIGDSREQKPKFNLLGEEITSGNGRATSPQLNTFHSQNINRSLLNSAHIMPGGFSSFPTNMGACSSLSSNVGGRTLSNNDLGVMSGYDGLSSSPSNMLQKQVDSRHSNPMPKNRSFVLGAKGDARYVNTDPYKGAQGYPAVAPAASRPLSSSQDRIYDHGQVRLPGLTLGSSKTPRITNQLSSEQLENRLNSARYLAPESSVIPPFIGGRGSTTRQDQTGQQIPAYQGNGTQATEGGHFPITVVQTASNLGRPQGNRPVLHTKDLLARAFTASQAIPVTNGNGLSHPSNFKAIPVTNGNGLAHPSNIQAIPVTNGNGLTHPYNVQAIPVTNGNRFSHPSNVHTGPPHIRIATQQSPRAFPSSHSNNTPPLILNTGQANPAETRRRILQALHVLHDQSLSTPANLNHPIPVAPKNLVGLTSTTGSVIPNFNGNKLSQTSSTPSRKRSAILSPPGIHRDQRIRLVPQPSARPSVLPPSRAAAPIPSPAQKAPLYYIRCEGYEEVCQPIEQKCPLCKRGLSYMPEGDLYQLPAISPPVAVLSCGHVFHDHCLELITPKEESKEPPCIPCALGEA